MLLLIDNFALKAQGDVSALSVKCTLTLGRSQQSVAEERLASPKGTAGRPWPWSGSDSLTSSLKNKQNAPTTRINLKGYPVRRTMQMFDCHVTETVFQDGHFLAQGWVSLGSKPFACVSPTTSLNRTALWTGSHLLTYSDSY